MTILYLRNTAAQITPTGHDYAMEDTRGPSNVEWDTPSTAGGTSIQADDSTAGTTDGADCQWFTRRWQAVTVSGRITCNIWCEEGGTGVNGGIHIKIHRVSSDGTELSSILETTFGTTDGGTTELTGTPAAKNWKRGDGSGNTGTGTVTSTALSAGDRLRIRAYLVNVGTMGARSPDGLQLYKGGPTAAANGDTYIDFATTLTEFVEATKAIPPGLWRKPRRVWNQRRAR